jgi:hypothetical protein
MNLLTGKSFCCSLLEGSILILYIVKCYFDAWRVQRMGEFCLSGRGAVEKHAACSGLLWLYGP